MADAEHPRTPDIPNWQQAFATLPLDGPPADAWSRLTVSLPTGTAASRSRGPSSQRTRWAMAAAIGVAALGDWVTMRTSQPSLPPVVATAGGSAATRQPTSDAMPARHAGPVTDDAPAVAAGVGAVASEPEAIAAVTGAAPATPPRRERAAGLTSSPPSRPAQAVTTAQRSGNDAVATSTTALASAARADGVARALDELRGESSRLEALVALARQSGMQSGPALVLTADIDDRLQLIDAALSQPSLDETERVDLWRRRVDTLGELAAIEGTQRWMAAQGYSMDAVARVD